MNKKIIAALILICLILPFLLGDLASVKAANFYKDIIGHEYEYEINKLFELNLLPPSISEFFSPDSQLTRRELAVFLATGLKYPLENPLKPSFKDVLRSDPAYREIETVKKYGLMIGFPDKTFKPNALVNRSQLVVVLINAKGLGKDLKNVRPVILSQDSSQIPTWALPHFSLALNPSNQLIAYKADSLYRTVSPLSPATRSEVAFGLYQILYPPKTGDLVNITLTAEPDTLSGWSGPLALTYSILNALHFPATGRDESWKQYPGLIEEIPTLENGGWSLFDSSMELTFRLRKGWVFHNGKELTLDDWAYNFMVFMDPDSPVVDRTLESKIDQKKGIGAYGIKGFTLLNEYSLKVYYSELDWKANLWLPGMSPHGLFLYPKELVELPYKRMKETGKVEYFIKDEHLSRKPIGLGAYGLVEWKPGQHILLERNEKFLLGKPLIKRLIFRFLPDTTTLLARLISGKDLDLTLGLAFDQALQFENSQSKHSKVSYIQGSVLEHIGINFKNPDNPLQDIRLRKAFLYALDREKIIQTLFEGKEILAHSFIPPTHWAYDSEKITKYSYNPSLAKKLLDEAGWTTGPDGFRYKDKKRLTIILETTAGITFRERVQSILKSQLREVGIDLDISKNLPASVLLSLAYRSAGRWPHTMMFGIVSDPLFLGDTTFRSDYIPNLDNSWLGMNYYGWVNGEATEYLKQASREISETKRKQLLLRVQMIITEELPIIPLYFRSAAVAYKKNLVGIKPIMIAGVFTTWNAYNWHWR